MNFDAFRRFLSFSSRMDDELKRKLDEARNDVHVRSAWIISRSALFDCFWYSRWQCSSFPLVQQQWQRSDPLVLMDEVPSNTRSRSNQSCGSDSSLRSMGSSSRSFDLLHHCSKVSFQDCGDNELHAIQFHPSGSLMATGGSDRKIHIWEINAHNSNDSIWSSMNSLTFRVRRSSSTIVRSHWKQLDRHGDRFRYWRREWKPPDSRKAKRISCLSLTRRI